MKTFINFLAGFFHGKQSMTRLVLFIATILLWGTWLVTSLMAKKPQELSSSVVTAYALAIGGKAAQNYFDQKNKTAKPTTSEVK